MRIFRGKGASPGLGIGEAFLLTATYDGIDKTSIKKIPPSSVKSEIDRFHKAVREAESQIKEIMSEIDPTTQKDVFYILEAHLMILSDRMLTGEVERNIRKRYSAEAALKLAHERLRKIFDEVQDEYISERRTDFDYVVDRIFRVLSGVKAESESLPEKDIILVARDISPHDVNKLKNPNVRGIVTETGSVLSHVAIIARSFGIPAVVGVKDITSSVRQGVVLAVDGTRGQIFINPAKETAEKILREKAEYERWLDKIRELLPEVPKTADGVRIYLYLNMEVEEEAEYVHRYKLDGVGLFRTELLYLEKARLPSENEHYRTYLRIIKRLKGQPLTIRTFDLGGDKIVKGMPPEDNPALGLRAIRLLLKRPHIFLKQIRGILRAGAHGPVKILVPLITNIEEVREVKKIVENERNRLLTSGVRVPEKIDIGIMMETPAACLCADAIAREVDFMSIGTNDLIQYTMAADRTNENVSHLFLPSHPSVIRLMENVLREGVRRGKNVVVCGEMSGEVKYLPLLLGMGFRHLSMSPPFVPLIKRTISLLKVSECKDMYEQVKKMDSAEEIDDFLSQSVLKMLPEHFLNKEEAQ